MRHLAFREQLTQQARPTRTQRRAYRQLTTAASAAREKQAAEIEPDDREHQRNGDPRIKQRLAQWAGDPLVE